MNPVMLGLLIGVSGLAGVALLAYKDIKFRRGLLVGLLKFVPLFALVGGSACAITSYFDLHAHLKDIVDRPDSWDDADWNATWCIVDFLTRGVPWYVGAMYGGMAGVAFALIAGLQGRHDDKHKRQATIPDGRQVKVEGRSLRMPWPPVASALSAAGTPPRVRNPKKRKVP
jgi:hypothetical protein